MDQNEKQIIVLMEEFEKLFYKMYEMDIRSFNAETVEKCKKRIKERQDMASNRINDKLKVFIRINPPMYENEAKNFIEDCKKNELIFKNEISEILKQIKAIKDEKIARQKAIL